MQWSRLEPEARALVALGVAIPLFSVVFLLAPADSDVLRISFLSFLAGAVTAAVCWQHFPGWDLFVAGCAFLVVGRLHRLPVDSSWLGQAALLAPAAAFWYGGARLSELLLVFPLAFDHRVPLGSWSRLQEEGRLGTLVVGLHAGVTAVVLGLLLPAADLAAFPLSLALGLVVGSRLPVRRPLWPVLGNLAGLWLAGGLGAALDRWAGASPVLPDPWLAGGLLTVGGLLGLWGSRWHRGEPGGPRWNRRPASEDLRTPGAAPPPSPPPPPAAPPPRAAPPRG